MAGPAASRSQRGPRVRKATPGGRFAKSGFGRVRALGNCRRTRWARIGGLRCAWHRVADLQAKRPCGIGIRWPWDPSRMRTRAPGQPICPRCPTRFARRSGVACACPAGLEPTERCASPSAQLAAARSAPQRVLAGRTSPKRQPARRRSGGRAATRACPARSLLRSPLRRKCLRKIRLLRAHCSRHVACPSQVSCPNLLLSATWKDKAFS